jgi:hypothetical protein
MAVEHHFVVYGVEEEDGSIRFYEDSEAATFFEGTMYDADEEEWRELSSNTEDEDWARDQRINQELHRRLTGRVS